MLSPLIALFACTILVGTIVSLWERIPWVLSERVKFPEPLCRDWQAWFSFPLIFSFPLLGQLIDNWDGRQYVLFIGILGMAVCLAWLGQVRSVGSSVGAILLLCLAIPCIVLPTLAILPQTFAPAIPPLPPSEDGGRLFKQVLVLNVAFAGIILGIALTPGLLAAVVKKFEMRHGFLTLALLCLVPALIVSLTPTESFARRESRPGAEILNDGRCWMLAALTFVYYLQAELFSLWRKGHLQQSGHDLPWVRGICWLTMPVGLLIAGWAVWNEYESWGLATLALIFAIIVGNMAGEYTSRSGPVSLWLAGASFAPFLPTLLTIPITARAFHDNAAGTMGLALGAGAVSNFLFQPMLERFARRRSVASSMWLSTILALAFGALAVLLALMLTPFTVRRR
jgi:MFS family permease